MPNEIPDKVSLEVRINESQADYARRLFMEAARIAGIPLLDQSAFAEYMINSGEHLFVGKDKTLRFQWKNDPSPKDNDLLVSDKEWKQKQGTLHTHRLLDSSKEELRTRQLYYTMNGGVLGSMIELRDVEEITVDLNIIYDRSMITDNVEPQTKLEYIQQNFEPKLRYWTETFYRIGLLYTIKYTIGGSNLGLTDIKTGRIPGMVNIFYLNDLSNRKYAKTKNGTDQIFMSERKNDLLRDAVLCHELGHIFGFTGLTGIYLIDALTGLFGIPNEISDAKINSALKNLEGGDVKYGIDWIDDYRKAPVYRQPQITKIGPGAAPKFYQREPTTFDWFRYGARILKEQKK